MVRLIMSFEEMEGIEYKVKIVVNRMGLESGQIESKEGQGDDWPKCLPPNSKRLSNRRSLRWSDGVPLIEQAPRAPITLAISQLTRCS